MLFKAETSDRGAGCAIVYTDCIFHEMFTYVLIVPQMFADFTLQNVSPRGLCAADCICQRIIADILVLIDLGVLRTRAHALVGAPLLALAATPIYRLLFSPHSQSFWFPQFFTDVVDFR